MKSWLYGLMLAASFSGEVRAQVLDTRAIETDIELAWMADPITFPYELRAFINKDGVVEVQGDVPSKVVRKQALNIARLRGPREALDLTEIVPTSEKPFVEMPADKVAALVQKRIAKALPQLAATVTVKCDRDGVVTLDGSTSTLAEKMTVGELVRRAPGCLRVDNRIRAGIVPIDAPIRQVQADAAAPVAIGGPVADVQSEKIRQKLVALFPGAKSISVHHSGPLRYQIQFVARTEDEASQLATHIFNRAEWKHLHFDIGARLPR